MLHVDAPIKNNSLVLEVSPVRCSGRSAGACLAAVNLTDGMNLVMGASIVEPITRMINVAVITKLSGSGNLPLCRSAMRHADERTGHRFDRLAEFGSAG
jgi:hypothetical protein